MYQKSPKHWKLVNLKDLVIIQKGKKPQTLRSKDFQGSLPYLDINALENNHITQYADKESSLACTNNDLLMVWDGSRSGLTMRGINGAVGSTLMLLSPFIERDYLYYFLKHQFDFINKNTVGDSIPHVNPAIFDNLTLPLPSISEQKRVLVRLEEELAAIEQKLNENKTKLAEVAIRRQQILEEAVSGKLTETWRTENNVFSNNKSILLKDISKLITKGSSPVWQGFSYIDNPKTNDILFITSENVGIYHILTHNLKYVEKSFWEKHSASSLQNGDILTNIVGASIGRTAIYNMDVPASINQAVAIIRLDTNIANNLFYLYAFNSPQVLEQINAFKSDMARANISLGQLGNLVFPYPTLSEQAEIVRLIEEKLQKANDLEKFYQTEIEKSTILRQSILQRAFEGDLSEVQEGDENVEDLLKRIREERTVYQTTIQQKKKMTINKEQRLSLEKLSGYVYNKLVESFQDSPYSSEELQGIAFFFAESEYKLVDENGKINFEDFANAFGFLVRKPLIGDEKAKVNMYFDAGKIYYQNNLI